MMEIDLASEKFVLASESNLSLATDLASWKMSLKPETLLRNLFGLELALTVVLVQLELVSYSFELKPF